jgi:hypothetical protein
MLNDSGRFFSLKTGGDLDDEFGGGDDGSGKKAAE